MPKVYVLPDHIIDSTLISVGSYKSVTDNEK